MAPKAKLYSVGFLNPTGRGSGPVKGGGDQLFAAITHNFERSVKVKFLRDSAQFLDQDQTWGEQLQLVHNTVRKAIQIAAM